jgi:hypothetical protein
MTLAELLVTRGDEILAQWKTQVSGSLHPEAMPHPQLVDHLPAFLDEMSRVGAHALRWLVCGGESMSPRIPAAFHAALPGSTWPTSAGVNGWP